VAVRFIARLARAEPEIADADPTVAPPGPAAPPVVASELLS